MLTFLNAGVVQLWEDFQLRVARMQRLDALLSRTVVVGWDPGAVEACERNGLQHCCLDRHVLDRKSVV